VDAFRRSASWLSSKSSFTDRDIEEALLSTFSAIDSPIAPARKGNVCTTLQPFSDGYHLTISPCMLTHCIGVREFLYQTPLEVRQRYRERLLAVTQRVCLLHLLCFCLLMWWLTFLSIGYCSCSRTILR
jgi:hypothetical protein